MLNNLTNFLSIFTKGRLKKTLNDSDIIPIGTRDPKFGGGYKPTAARFDLLKNKILESVSTEDRNNQTLEIAGEGDELALRNGSLNGTPVPDSVIPMEQIAQGFRLQDVSDVDPYSGNADKFLKVNASGNDVEWVDAPTAGGYTYTEVVVPEGVAATSGILGMGTVPVDLLPAPGANKYYEYKGVIEYTYNGTPYVLTGEDEAIVVGNYNLYAGSYIQNDLLEITASSVAFFSSDAFANDEFTSEPVTTNTASGASYPFPLNEAIQMFTWNGTDPTTGNGTILVKIWYKVKTFGTEL